MVAKDVVAALIVPGHRVYPDLIWLYQTLMHWAKLKLQARAGGDAAYLLERVDKALSDGRVEFLDLPSRTQGLERNMAAAIYWLGPFFPDVPETMCRLQATTCATPLDRWLCRKRHTGGLAHSEAWRTAETSR